MGVNELAFFAAILCGWRRKGEDRWLCSGQNVSQSCDFRWRGDVKVIISYWPCWRLTQWSLNVIADILQTTFSNAIDQQKILIAIINRKCWFQFWLKFHQSYSQGFNWQWGSLSSENGLELNMMLYGVHRPQWVNSLWPGDVIWLCRSGSTLAQIMMAPSHYLKRCWLIISKVLWHSLKGNAQEMLKMSILDMSFDNTRFKITDISPRGQWVNPLRAIFFRENINIYLHFMSFFHTNNTQLVEIPPRVRQGPAYST